jgi:hypothetical protein
MASLVRVASSYCLQPSGTMASGMAPRRRTKMDFGHDQRFRTTLGLSAGSDWQEGPLVRAAFGSLAIFTAILRVS